MDHFQVKSMYDLKINKVVLGERERVRERERPNLKKTKKPKIKFLGKVSTL
jgi:hypothetical protein